LGSCKLPVYDGLTPSPFNIYIVLYSTHVQSDPNIQFTIQRTTLIHQWRQPPCLCVALPSLHRAVRIIHAASFSCCIATLRRACTSAACSGMCVVYARLVYVSWLGPPFDGRAGIAIVQYGKAAVKPPPRVGYKEKQGAQHTPTDRVAVATIVHFPIIGH
jgi:hypothetical protein